MEFAAPRSFRVKATTWLGTVVLLSEAALMLALTRFVPPALGPLFRALAVLMLAGFAGAALVAVRGYRLADGELVVERPLWSTRYSLAGLDRVARDPQALRPTVFGFGNHGFFAVNSWRRIAPYGWCRVLATDGANAVVLHTAERTLVVTPDRPDEFVARAKEWLR
ncbi:MAG TPA: PH domain-containing protein [Myxococcota bacterium]|nr:PH domain-containing protein [Myxococcota bacterium]